METLQKTHRHNNENSQKQFDENQQHFNRQCRITLEQLLTGRGMNSYDSMVNLKIMHLARRIKTLRDSGIPVLDRPLGGGRKEYYIPKGRLEELRMKYKAV